MRKKILILGAGKGQVPFVELCKRKGYESIVVSIKGDYPCFNLADKFYYVDICDKDGVLQIAQAEKVDAILNQLDFGLSTVAYVSEKLGLPTIGLDVVRKFTNKHVMVQESEKHGICVPKHYVAKTLDEAIKYTEELGYPLIIKPTDNTASKGVRKIKDEKMLIDFFQFVLDLSKEKCIILQEYIQGQEYIVDSFVKDYECTPLIIGKSKYFNLENMFIPQSRIFKRANSVVEDIEKTVLEINEKLILSLQLKFGITHAEYIHSVKDGKVYLIEIAARGGGVNIASDLIPLLCGVDANEMLLNHLLGEQTHTDSYMPRVQVAGYFCFLLPCGVITSIQGKEDIVKIKNVLKSDLENIYLDKTVKVLSNKGSRFGPILIGADTEEECLNTWKNIKKKFCVKVQTQEEQKDIIWY